MTALLRASRSLPVAGSDWAWAVMQASDSRPAAIMAVMLRTAHGALVNAFRCKPGFIHAPVRGAKITH